MDAGGVGGGGAGGIPPETYHTEAPTAAEKNPGTIEQGGDEAPHEQDTAVREQTVSLLQ